MNNHLGNLEEAVLLITMYIDEAYGVSVSEEYNRQVQGTISIPAIHTVLRRLEEKGMLTSKMGEALPERGGRRKRLYEPTVHGFNIIKLIKKDRMNFWSKIPQLKLNRS